MSEQTIDSASCQTSPDHGYNLSVNTLIQILTQCYSPLFISAGLSGEFLCYLNTLSNIVFITWSYRNFIFLLKQQWKTCHLSRLLNCLSLGSSYKPLTYYFDTCSSDDTFLSLVNIVFCYS